MGKSKLRIILYGVIAALLLACLLDMPYGYYVFVRLAASLAFCYFAYMSYKEDGIGLSVLFLALAILFQPVIKIPLGRTIWNVVDVVVAGMLIFFLVRQKSR